MKTAHILSILKIYSPKVKYEQIKKYIAQLLIDTNANEIIIYINNVKICSKKVEYYSNDNIIKYKYVCKNNVNKLEITANKSVIIPPNIIKNIYSILNEFTLVNMNLLIPFSSIHMVFFKKKCIYSSDSDNLTKKIEEFENIIMRDTYVQSNMTYKILSVKFDNIRVILFVDITYAIELLSNNTAYNSHLYEINILKVQSQDMKKNILLMMDNLNQINDANLNTIQKKNIDEMILSMNSIVKNIGDISDYIKYEVGSYSKLKSSTDINKSLNYITNILSSTLKYNNKNIVKYVHNNVPKYIVDNSTIFNDLILNLYVFGIKNIVNGYINLNISSELLTVATEELNAIHKLNIEFNYNGIKNDINAFTNHNNGFSLIIAKKIITLYNSNLLIERPFDTEMKISFSINYEEDVYIREMSYLIEYFINKKILICGSSALNPYIESTLYKYEVKYTYDKNENYNIILLTNNINVDADKIPIVKYFDNHFNENKFIGLMLKSLELNYTKILICDDDMINSNALKNILNGLGYFKITSSYGIKECISSIKDKNIKILFLNEKIDRNNYEKVIKKLNKIDSFKSIKVYITTKNGISNNNYHIINKPYDKQIIKSLLEISNV